MGIRSRLTGLLGGKGEGQAATAVRVDTLGTLVSTESAGRKVAMFLGVPPELAGSIGGP